MIAIRLVLETAEWPDLKGRRLLKPARHKVVEVAGIEGGMASGKPSVSIKVDLENDATVIFETSLALFLTAADGLQAKFGDPRQ